MFRWLSSRRFSIPFPIWTEEVFGKFVVRFRNADYNTGNANRNERERDVKKRLRHSIRVTLSTGESTHSDNRSLIRFDFYYRDSLCLLFPSSFEFASFFRLLFALMIKINWRLKVGKVFFLLCCVVSYFRHCFSAYFSTTVLAQIGRVISPTEALANAFLCTVPR